MEVSRDKASIFLGAHKEIWEQEPPNSHILHV